MNFYNDNDPKICAWLRALVAGGLIPPGTVDERSICDIKPDDLGGYTQCHFFAGIGGWSLALQLAGWPADRPVWTGSCPCQPYSVAGRQKGAEDERNLWPAFFRLIRECRPDCVFGEQVKDAIGHGWLDGIQADLEGEGYAVGHCVLGAHSVGAPHQRHRLYWMADAEGQQPHGVGDAGRGRGELADDCGLVQPVSTGLEGYARDGDGGSEPGWISESETGSTAAAGDFGGMGDSTGNEQWGNRQPEAGGRPDGPLGGSGAWSGSSAILCADRKFRRVPVEPALFPLASRLPYKLARRRSLSTALLSGSGNSIVPQVAAEFIRACIEITTP